MYGAGFGEISSGLELEKQLEAVARRHGLPLCGPNGNGIVALHERLALWGDALTAQEPGRVALVSQSGNVAVNALATRRGRMENLIHHDTGWARMEYVVPSRGLIGFRTEFLTETRGTGVLHHVLEGYEPGDATWAPPPDSTSRYSA